MSDFYLSLTNKWNMDDVSGPPQDSIGTRHALSVASSPDRSSGFSFIYDGVNDDTIWSAANSPLPNGVDFTHTILWRPKASLENETLLLGEGQSGSKPYKRAFYWQDNGTSNDNVMSSLWGNSAKLSTSIGREFSVDEWVASVFSFDVSASTYQVVHRSMDGVDVSGSMSGASDPGSQTYYLARNEGGSNHYNYEVAEIGLENGTYHNIADMQDHADAMLESVNPNSEPTLTYGTIEVV